MARYQIIRQDNNGIRFVLDQKYSSREEVEAEKDKLEKRGHKQKNTDIYQCFFLVAYSEFVL